jgi:adenine deaminase
MRRALAEIKRMRGGVCVVRGGKVVASVALPVAGLMSDKRAPEVASPRRRGSSAPGGPPGCTLPYMGFNLIPLAVIPEIRITDKGLVTVPGMRILPLFEPA